MIHLYTHTYILFPEDAALQIPRCRKHIKQQMDLFRPLCCLDTSWWMMGCVMLFIRPRELAVSLPMLSSRKQCEEAMRCGGVYAQVCCKLSSQNMHFAPPICHISHPLPWLHITVSVILMYYRNMKLRRIVYHSFKCRARRVSLQAHHMFWGQARGFK